MADANSTDSNDYEVIFVPSFFHKGLGRKVFAYEYGKKCFALRIRKTKPANDSPKAKGGPVKKRSRKPKKAA